MAVHVIQIWCDSCCSVILCVVVSIYADIRDGRELEAMGRSDVTTVAESK